jgi:hypothetical protein
MFKTYSSRFHIFTINIYKNGEKRKKKKNGGDPLLHGAKALGSFIGIDEHIARALNQKVLSLNKTCKNTITKISNYQLNPLSCLFEYFLLQCLQTIQGSINRL